MTEPELKEHCPTCDRVPTPEQPCLEPEYCPECGVELYGGWWCADKNDWWCDDCEKGAEPDDRG